MGPAEDLPDDEQPQEPAREPVKRAARKAPSAAKSAAAEGFPPKSAPAKKTTAKTAPAKKAARKQTSPKSKPRKAVTETPTPGSTDGAVHEVTEPSPAQPGTTASGPAEPATSEPAESTAPAAPPAAPRKKAARQGGRFRRKGTVSTPTTSPIPKVPNRDPRRIQQRVAVVIPAKDEARRIAATVRAAKSIPQVDLVLVVDDGSEDTTQHVARDAGAVVVRHSHNRGKAAAMETGAAVVAMRDTPERPARLLLFIDADLGETAVNTAPLIPPVAEHAADFSIALLPPQHGAGGRGMVVAAARKGVAQLTGWAPTQPLSGMRCLTRAAFEAATPLARGWGVETGMTIDLLRQGFVAVEVPCDLRHRASGNDLGGQLHRAAQYRDVKLAISARQVRGAMGAIKRAVTPKSPQHP